MSNEPPPPQATSANPVFREVFEQHGPYVVRALRHLGVREADLPDAFQEVFTVVHRRLHEHDGRSQLNTWLYAIAWRVARDHRRRHTRKPEVLTDEPPERAAADDVEATVARKQQREALLRILDQLEEDQREIFVLYELGELVMSEIAPLVGCPLKTAYARLHAARASVEAIVRREKARGGLT